MLTIAEKILLTDLLVGSLAYIFEKATNDGGTVCEAARFIGGSTVIGVPLCLIAIVWGY